jgi:hypothetical protein
LIVGLKSGFDGQGQGLGRVRRGHLMPALTLVVIDAVPPLEGGGFGP